MVPDLLNTPPFKLCPCHIQEVWFSKAHSTSLYKSSAVRASYARLKLLLSSRGKYCIARYGGSCPNGFSSGYKYWDDEDSDNSNSKQDPLPDGDYGRNTRVYYCCRSDGSTSVGMSLPTSQPFVLYRYGGTCQTVRGMSVRQLHVHFDDEDSSNDNSCSGSRPDSSCDGNHDMNFCYYS